MDINYISVPLGYVERATNLDEVIHIDFETLGLYGDIVLAQFKQKHWDEALLVEYPNLKKLQNFIKECHVSSFPIAYDMGTLGIAPKKIDCMYIASKSAFPLLEATSLGIVAPQFFKGVVKAEMQKSFMKKRQGFTDEQLDYGARDVYALEWIYEQTEIQYVMQYNLSYQVDMKAQLHALSYQHNGMPVVYQAREDAVAKADKERAEYQKELNSILGFELNVKSWQQKQKAFPELPIDPKTGKIPTGEPAFKRLYLESLDKKYKLVLDTVKRRTELSDLEKYRESYIPNEDPVRIRTFFNVAGAITGRFTSKGGARVGYTNIQNIGRHFKHIFGYEDEVPRSIVSADYGTAEMIACASIHNVTAWVQAIQNGEDLHKAGHRDMFGVPLEDVSKDQRQQQKAINFGLIFGLGVEKFTSYAYDNYGVVFTEDEARDIKARYYKAYPEIARWHKKTAKQIKTAGFTVTTALGRIVKPDRYADALNIEIQGTVAEATKMAITYLYEDYAELMTKVMVINMVHDSIVLDVPDELIDEASICLESCMKLAWAEISKCPNFQVALPIKVDIDISKRWK